METPKWKGAGQRAGLAFMTSAFKTPGVAKGGTDRRMIVLTALASTIVGAVSYHVRANPLTQARANLQAFF